MDRFNYTSTKHALGISYLGGCNSNKLTKSLERNVLTYGLYLAPGNMSGYNVCPNSDDCCKKYCLNGSGRNKVQLLSHNEGGSIQHARIKKTKLFFENHLAFMHLLVHEIGLIQKKASVMGMQLAVRLNCTSDLSPEKFVLGDKNILQLFPDVQFYDYTKVLHRVHLLKKYNNYDLTFSYNGGNWSECEILLQKGYRVAVIFEDFLPATFKGYPVINADKYDARFLDPGKTICGLKYKRVANDYVNGQYQRPHTTFVNRFPYNLQAT